MLLSPYRVLELATGPGALCGRILADLGAEVVKLEPIEGDPMRTQAPIAGGSGVSFQWFNARKSGAAVDFQDPRMQRRIRESLAEFDVLIDGNSPGWLLDHGLDPEKLMAEHPHLVITSVSHFGQTGPYRDWAGSSLVDFALAGSLLRAGLPDHAPTAPPYLLPYAIAGITAASATVAALWQRNRTGNGDWIDCATIEAIQAQADWSVPGYSTTGHMAKRAGCGPLFRLYPADDGWVRVINLSAKQWRAVKSWLGNPPELEGPEWENPLYRAAHLDVQDRVFSKHFKGRTKVELFQDGQEHGVGIVPVYNPAEVMEDAHFRARGTFVPFRLLDDTIVRAPWGFVRMSDETPGPLPSAPDLDANNLGILSGHRERQAPVGGEGAPLAGIRVIEVGSGAVAPEITRVLGVLGADVIKLESKGQLDFMRLQGPNIESSSGWTSSNRNKRSVVVDMKNPEGRAVAQALARAADIIVENNTAGVMDRLGVGYADVARENPRIVYVSSQAFGATGPAAGYGGFGPTNQAISSTTYLWNHPDVEVPEGVQAIHPDHLLGRMGSMAAIAALDEMKRTGKGRHIDLGQAEFAMACIGEAFIESDASASPVIARGNESPLGVPHGVFPCAGPDEWIAVTIETDEQWQRLVEVVKEDSWKDEALASRECRLEQRDLIEAQLGAWTSQMPGVQLMRLLQSAGVPAAVLYSTIQVLADVHFAERGYFETVTHPVLGTLRMEGVPYKSRNMQLVAAQRAPLFGEHTSDVLAQWLDFDETRIAALMEAGVFK